MSTKLLLKYYYGEKEWTADTSHTPRESGSLWAGLISATGLNAHTYHPGGLYPGSYAVTPSESVSGLAVEEASPAQQIPALGARLRREADLMELRSRRLRVNRADLFQRGLNDEEMRVARRIWSRRDNLTISKISRYLQSCLTSRTFRMALECLSGNMDYLRHEIAAACELVRLIYPTVRQAVRAGPIYDELREFVEDRLDAVIR